MRVSNVSKIICIIFIFFYFYFYFFIFDLVFAELKVDVEMSDVAAQLGDGGDGEKAAATGEDINTTYTTRFVSSHRSYECLGLKNRTFFAYNLFSKVFQL